MKVLQLLLFVYLITYAHGYSCPSSWKLEVCLPQVCAFGICTPGACATADLCAVITPLKNAFDSVASEVTSLTNTVASKTTELANAVENTVIAETAAGINELTVAATDFADFVTDIPSTLETAGKVIHSGLKVPVQTFQTFPKLFANINPDEVSDFIKARGAAFIEWFSEALMDVGEGIGNSGARCATCWYDNLQNGKVLFSIGVDTGPSLGLFVWFAGTEPLECFVNSFAALSVILHDSIPDELQDGWDATADALVDAVKDLASVAGQIDSSEFCTNSDLIPEVPKANTGIDAVDSVLNVLGDFANLVGNDGFFGKFIQSTSDFICSAANPDEFSKFANDMDKFLSSVSFAKIEERIINGLYDKVNTLTIGLQTFKTMDFSLVDTAVCDETKPSYGCRLLRDYGANFVSCMQDQINSGSISINFNIALGEHWAPPSVTGVGTGIACSNLNCWNCLLNLENTGATLIDIISFLANEITGASTDSSPTTCNKTPQNCAGGSWDTKACACRCNNGFITTNENGCQICPTTSKGVCNGNGVCYSTSEGPACCCNDGINTVDCT